MNRSSYRSSTAWSCWARTLGSACVASATTVVVVVVGATVVVVVATGVVAARALVVVVGNEDPTELPPDELQLARASTATTPTAAVRPSRIAPTVGKSPRPHKRQTILGVDSPEYGTEHA